MLNFLFPLKESALGFSYSLYLYKIRTVSLGAAQLRVKLQ